MKVIAIIGGMKMTIRRTKSGNYDILADGKVVEGGFFSQGRAMTALLDYQKNEIENAEQAAR